MTAGTRESAKEKVLVYLFGSLGDSIVAIPALRAVRRHFPAAEIVMLQNFEAGHIVVASEVIPDDLVDRYLSYESKRESGRVAQFGKLWHVLRRENFDAAAYLIMSERPPRSVTRDRLFFRSAGIKQLYGFHPIPPADLYPVEPDGHPAVAAHEAEFKLNRLSRDGIGWTDADMHTPLVSFSASDLDDVDRWLRERRRRPELPLLSIGPGAKSKINEWPLDRFIEIARRLDDEYPCEIMVVGGLAEREMGDKIVDALGSGFNTAGTSSVRRSAALLSRSRLHFGLDTGTTHLAAAAGTRCFAIYGEKNNPGTWYPLGAGHTIISRRVACAGCRLDVCSTPGHPCIDDISVESVWRAIRESLDEEMKADRPRVRVVEA